MPNLYFKKVNMSGGGYMTGIYAHQTDPTRIISRCDVAGFFIWQSASKTWKQLLDFAPEDMYCWGPGGCSFHPTDSNTFWISQGSYVSGAFAVKGKLFKTVDGGSTFTELTFPNIAIGGGAGVARYSPRRLAICPTNNNILIHCGYSDDFSGGSGNGIYRTTDGATNWSFINFASLAPGQIVNTSDNKNIGQTFIVWDDLIAGTCYVGIYGLGVCKSTDYGVTWSFIGGAKYINEAVVYNSILYTASELTSSSGLTDSTGYKGLSKYSSGSWANISAFEFRWIAVNKNTGEMSAGHPFSQDVYKKGYWYYSNSQWGSSTQYTFGNYIDTVPYFADYPVKPSKGVSSFCYTADNKTFISDFISCWKNDNYHSTNDLWVRYSNGIENTVLYDALFIPNASNKEITYSSFYDILALNHDRGFDSTPTKKLGYPNIRNESSYNISYCKNSVGNIAFATSDYSTPPTTFVMHTSDYGATWVQSSISSLSRVCFSSSNPNLIVALRRGNTPQFADSKTNGVFNFKDFSTTGLPYFCYDAPWYFGQPIVADPNNGNVFYAVSDNQGSSNYAKLYKFTYSAGAMSAVIVSDLSAYATYNPGLAARLKILDNGTILLGWQTKGLFISNDSGLTFTPFPNITNCVAFDFGAAKPDTSNKTFWLWGSISNVYGLWESNDLGTTWNNRLDTTLYSSYNEPGTLDFTGTCLAASQQTYPLLVVGSGGHGAKYTSETPPNSGGGGSSGGVSSGGIVQLKYDSSVPSSLNTIQMRII